MMALLSFAPVACVDAEAVSSRIWLTVGSFRLP